MRSTPSMLLVLGLTTAALHAGCGDDPKPAPTGSARPPAPAAASARPTASATAAASAAPAPVLLHDLGEVVVPADNPQTPAKIALGHQLFFDKRLSKDGSRACYSCHLNEDGNGGKDPLAIGPGDKVLPRHSPVIWNVAYLSKFYWDGRSDSLEAQATAAWAGGNMAVGKENLDAKAAEIAKIPAYKKAFDEVFPGEGVTPATIVKAISAYERTLVCKDTAYDRYAKGEKSALTEQQQQGLELFNGKAGCAMCHAAPFFSSAFGAPDGAYFNVGIGTKDKAEADVDVGRMSVTKKDADWAAFKPPSLRNVSKSAPYFHDGSVKTLREAVVLMASGGIENKNRSALLQDKKLTDAEIDALVAFLGALDCNTQLEEPKLP
jgi:cytochrome c peroxidase